jgi:hypothetical protein
VAVPAEVPEPDAEVTGIPYGPAAAAVDDDEDDEPVEVPVGEAESVVPSLAAF